MSREDQIRQLCERFYQRAREQDRERRSRWRAPRDRGLPAEDELDDRIAIEWMQAQDEAERMMERDRAAVAADAIALAREAGLSTEGSDFDQLCYELQRTLIRALYDSAAEWEA